MKKSILLLGSLLSLGACVDSLPIESKQPCPCATGWQCCADSNVCVEEGTACPSTSMLTPELHLLSGQLGGRGNSDGIGAEAHFQNLSALAMVDGTLYAGDNQVLRKVDVGTGRVETISGGVAPFVGIRGLVPGPAGVLYVLDAESVRAVTLATGDVSTVVDHIFTGVSAGYDPAGYLYAFSGSLSVIRIELATQTVTTIAGGAGIGSQDGVGADATFNYGGTGAIAYDGDGTLYVGDLGTIRAVDVATGKVTTLVGSPTDLSTVDGPFAMARLGSITHMAYDKLNTRLVFSEDGSTRVRVVNLGQQTVFELAQPDAAPYALTTSDGVTYVSDGAVLQRFDGHGLSHIAGSRASADVTNGPATLARFRYPHYLAQDGAGHLFVTEGGTTIRQVDLATGTTTTLAGSSGTTVVGDGIRDGASFKSPGAMAYDGHGGLFVTDACTVRRVDVASGQVTTLAGSDPIGCAFRDGVGTDTYLKGPVDLATDGRGTLYVLDQFGLALRTMDVDSGQVTTILGDEYGPVYYRRLVMDGSDLLVLEGANVHKLDPATHQLVPVLRDLPFQAAQLVVDARHRGYAINNLYQISRVDLATGAVEDLIGRKGVAGVKLGALPAGLNGPVGMALVGNRLAIADQAENAILLADLP